MNVKKQCSAMKPLIVGVALCVMATMVGVGTVVAAQVPTPVPTQPGQVRLPTATPTIVGGPTATPSRTPTITPVLVEAIGEANLRSGPGLGFEIVGTISAGNPIPVVGRSLRYPWYAVEWEKGPGGIAWVFDQLVIMIGDITTVPIIEEPELPTIDPTQAAIQATATVLLQTPGAAETATATAFFAPTGVFTLTPGGSVIGQPGVLPTFTPPGPVIGPDMGELQAVTGASDEEGGIPPAVVIISLGAMGLLTLTVGLLRRI